jgi:SulP family sulfate permease
MIQNSQTSVRDRSPGRRFGWRSPAQRATSQRFRDQWLVNPTANLLSGMVVALALIPEAISFSIIAGVDPKVGLYASFSIAIIISSVLYYPGPRGAT